MEEEDEEERGKLEVAPGITGSCSSSQLAAVSGTEGKLLSPLASAACSDFLCECVCARVCASVCVQAHSSTVSSPN